MIIIHLTMFNQFYTLLKFDSKLLYLCVRNRFQNLSKNINKKLVVNFLKICFYETFASYLKITS